MDEIDVVTHPFKIAPLLVSAGTVISRTTFGPIGLNRYRVSTEQPEAFRAIRAYPYCFVFETAALAGNSVDDCLTMLSTLLKMYTGTTPDSFEQQHFAFPPTTHFYPVYSGQYLHVCDEERQYIAAMHTDIHTLLGLRSVTHDPLCWLRMTIANPIEWLGGCVIRSEDFLGQRDNITETLRYMEQARRRGFSGLSTNTIDDEINHLTAEMRNGPVIFQQDLRRDLQLERISR